MQLLDLETQHADELFRRPQVEENVSEGVQVSSTIRKEEADHTDVLRHQLREKEQTIEKLKDQLNSAGDVIRKQTEQIEILKSANTSVAMEKENTEKELRKRLKDYEKQLMICKSEHVDKCLIVDHMRRLLNGVLTNNQLDVI